MIRPKHWLASSKLYNKPSMNPADNSPVKTHNPLEVMSPGEQNVMEIKRHPFGLVGLYLTGGLLAIVLIVGAALIPHFASDLTSQDKMGIFAGALVLIAIVLLYMYVAAIIYKGNRWIVTTDSITQINQVGLFKKVTSQLSLANLEDVTFEQESIIQTMFGFGTLKVESAGEHSKFFFTFCPKPADCARKIITAHEQFITARPENMEQANRGSVETHAFEQQAYSQQPPSPVFTPPITTPVQKSGDDDDGYSVPN